MLELTAQAAEKYSLASQVPVASAGMVSLSSPARWRCTPVDPNRPQSIPSVSRTS
ncbi:hypothetical protein [Methylobacterium sp. WL64]|uniref:hypothetical protein n=1 Tax=Methylobacterium sp. WL64 TaxID=2603894 RepID=UPI001650B708|nr:hypothetical protein [Methylobacterium sp. WL64]